MFCGIHMRVISQEVPINLIHDMILEVAILNELPHYPGDNELNTARITLTWQTSALDMG